MEISLIMMELHLASAAPHCTAALRLPALSGRREKWSILEISADNYFSTHLPGGGIMQKSVSGWSFNVMVSHSKRSINISVKDGRRRWNQF